jgi:hypothetical protein
MKRPRYQPKPRFINSHEPVGLADLYPDFYCDLPEHVRRTLPSEVLKASRMGNNVDEAIKERLSFRVERADRSLLDDRF